MLKNCVLPNYASYSINYEAFLVPKAISMGRAFHAEKMGNLRIATLILSHDDVMADLRDEGGRKPLSWAVEMDQRDIVTLLLER